MQRHSEKYHPQLESDKKRTKMRIPDKTQPNEKPYVKRDLFKSTLNFREMCTGSEAPQ